MLADGFDNALRPVASVASTYIARSNLLLVSVKETEFRVLAFPGVLA